MRCPYCGTENPADHRFCGMCGRPLVAIPQSEPPAPPQRDHEAQGPAPAYTGGIFNLGAPGEKSSRNLDYLLEDDEEPKSNKGLIFLCLVALLLVLGLGWLRWHNVNLSDWFKAQPARTATTSAPSNPDAAATSSPSDQPNPSASIQPLPSAGEPPSAIQTLSTPTPTSVPYPEPSNATSIPPANAAPSTTDSTSTATVPPNPASSAADPNTPNPAATDKADSTPSAPAAVPSPAKPKAAARPASKPAAKPPDQVALGEQYLYGRGVPQNCEKGLRYVKPAADQSNPKAMITMGALYATGHCISRDLPTAYRFFALALRVDPENGPLRQNAEMVWKQMTAEERKQAIRMTQ